jgi:hypothetical protein
MRWIDGIPVRAAFPNGKCIRFDVCRDASIDELIATIADFIKIPARSINCWFKGQFIVPFAFIRLLETGTFEIRFNEDNLTYTDLARLSKWKPRPPDPGPNPQDGRQLMRIPPSVSRLPVSNPVSAPYILCHICAVPLKMLIDTGASVSVLYKNHTAFLGIDDKIDTSPASQLSFRAVDSLTKPSVGIIPLLEVIVEGTKTETQFVIFQGECDSGLLGMDWLRRNGGVLDIPNNCLYLGGQVVPFRDLM